jgi:hypothetical protein
VSVKLCECGCGLPAPLAKCTNARLGRVRGVTPVRFVFGHSQRRQVIRGYRLVRRGRSNVGQHVLVAERALGRKLPAGAVVHHVDGNKSNNAGSNLVICQSHRYHMLLHVRMRVRDAGGDPNTDVICGRCRQVKHRDMFSPAKGNYSTGRAGICRLCSVERASAYRARRRPEDVDLDRVVDPEWS